MIFLGDIACPACKVSEFTSSVEELPLFNDEIVILNLEATISDDCQDFNNEKLFNSKNVLDGFHKAKKVVVSLANNHMYDYPDQILPTADYLMKKGIGVFGICDKDGSFKPFEYKTTVGQKLAFFGHCWRLYTDTNTNCINDVRVVDHDYREFIKIVTIYKKNNPDTEVYCFMHWNYDLERFPFPMHIKIARTLIDNGVSGVIGSHSHRVQAAELYKGKPIVYGLGNFYLPSGVYFSGRLSYPVYSNDTYALVTDGTKHYIQWFRNDDKTQGKPVVIKEQEEIDGAKISEISCCLSLDTKSYITFFRKHREKKLLVPVFTNYAGLAFSIKEKFAIMRVKILRKLLNK